jgi:hypothetical protein
MLQDVSSSVDMGRVRASKGSDVRRSWRLLGSSAAARLHLPSSSFYFFLAYRKPAAVKQTPKEAKVDASIKGALNGYWVDP